MGRYYTGDIEGKMGFGTQPSSTFEQFGGTELEPTVLRYQFTGVMSDDNEYGFDKDRLLYLVNSYNSNIKNWKEKYKYCKPESLSEKEQDLMKLLPIEDEDIDKIIKEDNWEEGFELCIMDPYLNYLSMYKNPVSEEIRLLEDIFLGLKIYKQVLNNEECYVEVDI